MLDDIMIPEAVLAEKDSEMRTMIETKKQSLSADIDDPTYGPSLRHFLLLSEYSVLLQGSFRPDSQKLFYNKYYWFVRFVRLYSSKCGQDAGLEQQAFQMLEQESEQLDWSIVEEIDKKANEQA
jgi:hypothetical protein